MATTDANLALAFNLTPERAVEYFQAKGLRVTSSWRDMAAGAHAGAFTVAGVLKGEVLQDIRSALDQALAEGTSFQDFVKTLRPQLQKRGWWGSKPADPETGEVQSGRGMTPYRLKTVFQTNLQSSYMAGRYKAQLENADKRPYWKYVAILDSRTRPRHRALNGRIFRYDDPIWGVIYPPNGYNCRCRVVALSQEEFEADGGLLSKGGDYLETRDIPVGKSGETVPVTGYKDPSTGDWFGPDVGFDTNPGESTWGRDVALARRVHDIKGREIRTQVWQALNGSGLRQTEFMDWVRAQHVGESPRKSIQAVGFLSEEIAAFWAGNQTEGEAVRVVGMQGGAFKHADSVKHVEGGFALSIDQYAMLPGMLAEPEDVYFDTKWKSLVFTRQLVDERSVFMSIVPGRAYPVPGQGHQRQVIDGIVNAYLVPADWMKNAKRFIPMKKELP